MAFDFDWTPMGAVGRLAEQAGKGRADARNLAAAVQMRGQNLADARARDQTGANQMSQLRGFGLQLADSARKDRQLTADIEQGRARTAQEQGKLQSMRDQRDQDMADWDSIRGEMSNPDYIRGLVAIRSGRTPPALSKQRSEFDAMYAGEKQAAWAVNQIQKYGDLLQDYRQDESGKWLEIDAGAWYAPWKDTPVKDAGRIEQLNIAKRGVDEIAMMQNMAQQQQANQAAQQGPEARLQFEFNSYFSSKSAIQQSKISQLLQAGWTMQDILGKEREAQEQSEANSRNWGR